MEWLVRTSRMVQDTGTRWRGGVRAVPKCDDWTRFRSADTSTGWRNKPSRAMSPSAQGARGKTKARRRRTWYDACNQNNTRTSSHPRFFLYYTYPSRLSTSRSFSSYIPHPAKPQLDAAEQHTRHDCPTERIHQPGRRGAPSSQGRRYPRDGNVLPPACTCFHARIHRTAAAAYSDPQTHSASRRRSSRCSTTCLRASTPLVSARSSWRAATTARTSTPLHSPVR